MANSISSLNGMTPSVGMQSLLNSTNDAAPAGGPSFQSLLLDSIGQAAGSQRAAESAIETSLAGGDITQVEVLTAVKKADLSLRMMLQIRNKVMDAYEEIKQLRM